MERQPINFWDERFQQEDYVFGTEPNEFVKQAEPFFSMEGQTLSIAEGEGRNSVFLAKQGHRVTAWDYAPSGLEKIQRLAESQGVRVTTELVDLQEAEWQENVWDEVVCVFGHFPAELRAKTLQGIKKAVKPGGIFVCEVYSPYQLLFEYGSGGPKDLTLLYRPEDFLGLFSDWKIHHFFMGEVVRHEGPGHNGLSHVIQFIGRKLG